MAIYKKCALFHLVFAVVVVSVKTSNIPDISDPCPVQPTTVRSASTGFDLKQYLYDKHVEYKPEAVILRKALDNTDGSQVDERAIIDVFVKHDVFSCAHIKDAYRECYGEDLLGELKKKLNPKTRDLILALIHFWYDYYAEKLHEAVSSRTTDNDTIIDIFSTQDSETICSLKEAYQRAYNESLESHLERATSGDFRRFLVSMLSTCCSGCESGDERQTTNDAEDLHKADEKGKVFESLISTILTSPESELYATIRRYERISHHSIEEKISENLSGPEEKLLLGIVKHVKSDKDFFVTRLRASVDGRMDYRVINMFFVNIISRQRYLKAFEKRYGKPFESFITTEEPSDNYDYALRLLIQYALNEQ